VLVIANVKNLITLSISIEVMNALLLPIVLGFLFVLARRALPEKFSLKGWYAFFVGFILSVTSVLGILGSLLGFIF
jgi:hypothetical protein